MATYIVLGRFTDQGVRNVKQTTQRAAAIKELGTKLGVTVKDIYWTLGEYDVLTVLDAPDDATLTAFGLTIGALGNVRSESMRAFNAQEMGQILAKMN